MNSNKTNISVAGASGRMGKMVVKTLLNNNETNVISATCHPSEKEVIDEDAGILAGIGEIGVLVSSDPKDLLLGDVIIDFTSPHATLTHAKLASENKVAHIIGTTGLSQDHEKTLKDYSRHTPIVYSSNMSVGVNLLFGLVEDAVKKAGLDWNIEILEMHHNKKVDAPSGTAISLGHVAAKAINKNFDEISNFSRNGLIGKRGTNEIGFAVLRGGSIVGEHTVVLATENERIELSHKAENRNIFANGAVRAALWVINKKPGFYHMKDVLGIK